MVIRHYVQNTTGTGIILLVGIRHYVRIVPVDHNTASGYQALYSNTTGDHNTASGYQALYSNNRGKS